MISEDVVVAALFGEGGALAIALALLIGHGLNARVRLGLLARRVAAARATLIAILGDTEPGSAVLRLPRLPLREELEVLGALRPSIAGADHDRIAAIAQASGLGLRGERMCESWRWRRRLRGVRILTLLGGGESAVPPLLDDPHSLVRAQAVQWAADHASPAVVARIVDMLNHPGVVAPFTVRDTLQRIGMPAVTPLIAHLERTAGGAARDALRVADDLADPRMLGAALRLSSDPDSGTRSAAARLLGAIGGADALTTVERLLEDPDAEVRATAAHALGRSGHRAAASTLVACLRDPAWPVRRAAALSLRSFGAAGILLLRRTLKDEDRYARDMARQTLDLPEAATG